MSTSCWPRHSRKRVPAPTGPGESISTFVIPLMWSGACAKSDANDHRRSGGADERCVQSSGFIGRSSRLASSTTDVADAPECARKTGDARPGKGNHGEGGGARNLALLAVFQPFE